MTTFRWFARRYWFDGLLVVGIGVGLAGVVVGQGRTGGPEGPAWFDALALVVIIAPLFFRRRYPFGAPVAVGVAVVLTTFVDPRLTPFAFVTFLAGCAAVFFMGMLLERSQAVAGLAIALGVESFVAYKDPKGDLKIDPKGKGDPFPKIDPKGKDPKEKIDPKHDPKIDPKGKLVAGGREPLGSGLASLWTLHRVAPRVVTLTSFGKV